MFLGGSHIDGSVVIDGGSHASATGEDFPESTKAVATQKWKPAGGNENLFVHYTADILSRIGDIASCTIMVDKENGILEIKAESKESLAIACCQLQNLQKSLVSRSAHRKQGMSVLTDAGGIPQPIQT